MIRLSLALLVFSVFGVGCNNNRPIEDEPERISDVNPNMIWFDYQVTGEEGNDSVTVKLQYRAGEEGPTLQLTDPSKVEIDGKEIKFNATKITGPYYEMQFPANNFSGEHLISFTNLKNKRYDEKFSYHPISLQAEVPAIMKRGTIIFQLKGLSPGGRVRILMNDTAYASEGINRLDTISNGQIIITEQDLEKLSNGPIQFVLIRENERDVNEGTREGGRIAITYSLKREFILED